MKKVDLPDGRKVQDDVVGRLKNKGIDDDLF